MNVSSDSQRIAASSDDRHERQFASSSRWIRPLRATDVEPLHALLVATEVFTPEEVAIALELMHTSLNSPHQRDYLFAVYDNPGEDGVLGYYCIGPTPATVSTYDLYWIATHPTVHGKGIGRALLADAEDRIRAFGGTLVIAETSSTPRYDKTRTFYISAGYTELARIRDYYRPGDSLVVYGKYL